MTVQNLKKALEAFPDCMEVYIDTRGDGHVLSNVCYQERYQYSGPLVCVIGEKKHE